MLTKLGVKVSSTQTGTVLEKELKLDIKLNLTFTK